MKRIHYAGLFLLGLVVALAASQWISIPGYMDAEYYYSGGIRLAQGHGLTELVLWNYLDNPTSLPHPSHVYWMPLASLLAALGMKIGGINFPAAQVPFLLLAACLPPLAARLACELTGRTEHAWMAGLLAVFPGYYLPYYATTESFLPYMILGAAAILLLFSKIIPALARFALLGIIAGLMHLSRADGLIWLGAILAIAIWQAMTVFRRSPRSLLCPALVLIGYAVVTSFWYARNLQAFGSLMPPGGSRALWLTNYDQTFNYPADTLTWQSWLASGWAAILRARWDALLANLKTLLAVQGEIFLLPLMIIGLWRLRRDPRVLFGAAMWLATLAFMTFVFPFAGSRGGFLHSGAAVQLLLWALVPVGFDAFVQAGVRWRDWRAERAWKGFGAILAGLVTLLTLALYIQNVVGADFARPAWQNSWNDALTADELLNLYGASSNSTILINNPPGLFAATGRPALVIPNGDETTAVAAAKKFGAEYLILEANHVTGLDTLYRVPCNRNGLVYLGAKKGIQLYKLGNKP